MFTFRPMLLWLAIMPTLLSAQAQEALTLEAAVQHARAHHPALREAQAMLTAADASLRGARAWHNPEITVTPGILGAAGSDELLSIAQPLEINGARQARTNTAAGLLEATHAEYQMSERALILAVKTAYWNLAVARAVATFDAESVTHAETLLAAARKQVELGNEPTAHVIKAEVELARARQQRARSQAADAQAQTALNAAMGREPHTRITPVDSLTYTPMVVQDAVVLQQGLAHRPELHRDQALITAALGDIDAARAAQRPDVAIQVRRESWEGDGGVGLAISLPFIDWGSARAERDRAQAMVSAQQHRLETTRVTVRQEISAALIATRGAEAQILTLRDQVLAPSEQLAQMATLGYEEGAMTYLEVLEARRTLRAAHTEYLTALGEYQTALAQLAWAVGTPIRPATTEEVPQ